MVKSVYVGLGLSEDKYKELGSIGANHLIVAGQNINKKRWKMLQKTGADLTISVDSFEQGACPLDPKAKVRLEKIIGKALKWRPKEIWLDHFRFDGHWEAISGKEILGLHKQCQWCRGKDRAQEIAKLAAWAKDLIPSGPVSDSRESLTRGEALRAGGRKVKVGYFAVPFKKEEVSSLVADLGQDHRLLGKVFDTSSPMLYHRMIKKPVSYISEYIKYLYGLTNKPVFPIIQIKEMPDDLPDMLKKSEFFQAFSEAAKSPSSGVSIFYWKHAIEKDKVDWIKEAFSST